MFGFKKILNELQELRKDVNELKKYSKPELFKEGKPKKAKTSKKLNFEKKTNADNLALGKMKKDKDLPIYGKLRHPTDMTIKEFSKELHVTEKALRARLSKMKHEGVRWVENDNFVYYLKKGNNSYVEKILTEPAQNQIIRRYGYGMCPKGRRKEN